MITSLNEGDKNRIAEIISTYDRLYPVGVDSIAAAVTSAKREQQQLEVERKVSSKTGVINQNEAGRRMTVSMPSNLYIVLRKQYPTLFSKDIKWFKRNFPLFVMEKQRGL